MAGGHFIQVPGPTKSNWPRDVVRGPCGTADIWAGCTSLQGGPGKPLAHPDVPRRVLEAPWTWVSWEVPRTSPVLPGLSGRLRSSPKFPWGFLGFRTSQRLLAASSGRPDVPGASPGLPGTSGCARGGCSGLFEVSYAFPEVSQTGMTDRIPPVSEAAAVPAHQRHVLVSVHWFETFVAVPPLGGP